VTRRPSLACDDVTSTATFICPYCGEEKDRTQQSIEHPLPRALGGHGFSSPDHDDPCNKRAGREVDRPFVEHEFMRALRHRHGVRDARGQIPPAPRLYGDSEDGGRGFLELGAEPRVRRVPRRTRNDANGTTLITEIGDGAEIAAKELPRMEQRARELHGDGGFRVESSIEQIRDEGELSILTSLSMTLWPRFGAKLGLALGREALGDGWLHSQDAARLRRLLWNEPDAPQAQPLPEHVEAGDVFALIAPPPTHLVYVGNFHRGCGLIVQLFGTLRYAVPLSDTITLVEPAVWTFDPVAGTASRTGLAQLIADRPSTESG
jgi:hypothetical protein